MTSPRELDPPRRPRLYRLLDYVLVGARPVGAIFLQGIHHIFWGGWCLGWWSVYEASTIYGLMGERVPEDLAGSVLVALGIPMVLAPVIDEDEGGYRWLVHSIAVGSVWWAFVVVSCVDGNMLTTATPVYSVFCGAHLWFWSLLRRDL